MYSTSCPPFLTRECVVHERRPPLAWHNVSQWASAKTVFLARWQRSNMADKACFECSEAMILTPDTLPKTTLNIFGIDTGKCCILLMIFISFSRSLRTIASL